MAYEAEGSDIRFEIPDHYCGVGRTTDNLFKVGIEATGEDALFVAFEGPFE